MLIITVIHNIIMFGYFIIFIHTTKIANNYIYVYDYFLNPFYIFKISLNKCLCQTLLKRCIENTN